MTDITPATDAEIAAWERHGPLPQEKRLIARVRQEQARVNAAEAERAQLAAQVAAFRDASFRIAALIGQRDEKSLQRATAIARQFWNVPGTVDAAAVFIAARKVADWATANFDDLPECGKQRVSAYRAVMAGEVK